MAVLLLLLAALVTRRESLATQDAVAITFAGYTNVPSNVVRFALFSVSNRAVYSVRWRGDWVEEEGSQVPKGRLVNPGLPGFSYSRVLPPGLSLTLAVGEPFDSLTGHWRFGMAFTRYTLRERLLDFSKKHKIPLEFGTTILVDASSITNRVTVTTEWLTNGVRPRRSWNFSPQNTQ
jgi:hypothetical protein